MTEAKPRGRFVWFDLMTPDPDVAPAFYTKVTGWGTMAWPGGGPTPYTMWMMGEKPLGGIGKLEPGKGGPHWLGYISTPDIHQTVKEAVDLGGKTLVPPTSIPTVGMFSILSDPHGAVFAAFTPEVSAPGHEGEAELGEFSWHELATHDYPAAFRFYERLFGWEKMTEMDMGPSGVYFMFGRKGVMLGGMFNTSEQMPAPIGWLHYVLVDDIDRAVAAVKAGGGTIMVGPMEVPGGDMIAQCMDPQGAMFAVHARKK
jgi:predicted enzyme related to lactoylglutathione lyase